ncbi:hypothetical protein C5167_040168 [Papaver somniferum]|uniref:peptidylprolyl isomerase n=1 Tax=Papaver somniferum TaxID=3469 RepID=A0A4Y7IGL3_PAPSO|nr:hypothetical protein C5167_040168 [Papaver somniferum]
MLKWLKTMEGTRQLKVDIYIETHANKDSRKASDRISEGYIAQIREQNGFDEVGSTARQMSLRVKKKLIKEGQSWDTPENGNEVEVHYTGTLLNGIQFDSNHDQGTPFKFKAWASKRLKSISCAFVDVNLLSDGGSFQGMAFRYQDSEERRKCNLTIPAELAYGEAGFPPTIPPSATLQFNWSYSWSSVKDICKDEGIAKEVLTEAETWENPKDLGEVLGMFLLVSVDVPDWVLERYFCLAPEKAVRTMKKKEKVLLTMKPHCRFSFPTRSSSVFVTFAVAFLVGEVGQSLVRRISARPRFVPPGSTVYYEVELASFVKDKESCDMSNGEKIIAASKTKEKAIRYFLIAISRAEAIRKPNTQWEEKLVATNLKWHGCKVTKSGVARVVEPLGTIKDENRVLGSDGVAGKANLVLLNSTSSRIWCGNSFITETGYHLQKQKKMVLSGRVIKSESYYEAEHTIAYKSFPRFKSEVMEKTIDIYEQERPWKMVLSRRRQYSKIDGLVRPRQSFFILAMYLYCCEITVANELN